MMAYNFLGLLVQKGNLMSEEVFILDRCASFTLFEIFLLPLYEIFVRGRILRGGILIG